MYHPKLSEEASEYLVREYVEMRKLGASRGQVCGVFSFKTFLLLFFLYFCRFRRTLDSWSR